MITTFSDYRRWSLNDIPAWKDFARRFSTISQRVKFGFADLSNAYVSGASYRWTPF